ncbi:MAG: acetyl-CoA decarbonylase/synthase complex subunit delta [bacterium]
MPFSIPKEMYNGKINQIEVGQGDHACTIGGSEVLPFLSFEGKPNPKIPIAMEIADTLPEGFSTEVSSQYPEGVINDPVRWATYCQDELKADMICLRLLGTHPDEGNRSPEEARKTVEAVKAAINIPLMVFGTNSVEKDAEVFKVVSEALVNTNSIIGKAQEKNYKTFAAMANAYNLKLVAVSDLDINLCKQLNILLTQAGFDVSNILVDPMSSTVGYGLEYTYSVMERIRMAALLQSDTMMQTPIISDICITTWKIKETRATQEEQPKWGDLGRRGYMWEAMTANAFLMAGSDLLIMRHPKAMGVVKKLLADL